MNLFDIKCFLCAAKTLNFSRASEELFISQAAMSSRIKSMEEELGVRLFHRDTHAVSLTKEGKLAVKSFSSIMDTYESLKLNLLSIAASETNHLSIGYNGPHEWANIHQLIRTFSARNPQITLDIKINRWGKLVSDLRNGNIDLIFTEKSEIKYVPDISSVPFFRDDAVLAVSPDSPIARFDSVNSDTIQELLKDIPVFMENDQFSPKTMPILYERLSAAGFSMEKARLVENHEIAMAMVSSGIGVAPFPKSFILRGNPDIHYVDIASDELYLDFCLAWLATNDNPGVNLFCDFCKTYAGAREGA